VGEAPEPEPDALDPLDEVVRASLGSFDGKVARRSGHSVETLVGTYVRALDGGDDTARSTADPCPPPPSGRVGDVQDGGSAKPASPPAPLPRTAAKPGE
jgi:hypothetical protein